MKVRVEACWGAGGGRPHFHRVTLPGKERFRVGFSEYGGWTRAAATEALDYMERYYGVRRKTVRFDHV